MSPGELARRFGVEPDAAQRLWDHLGTDPHYHLALDPEAWRREAFLAVLESLRRPGKETAVERANRGAPSARPLVPGKTTLVESLNYTAEPTASDVPFRAELEPIFGESFAGVRAYVKQDALLAPHGAQAAAWRDGVAFASEPSKALVAHELTHIVQLRNNSALPGRSTPSDASERAADGVARAVAAGARRVSVGAVRTASLSFSPDRGPGHVAPPTMSNVVNGAVDRAQTGNMGFADAFAASRGLDAAIAASVHGNEGRVRDALIAAAHRIAAHRAQVKMAGQAQPQDVSLDDLLRLFTNVFVSPELEKFGLPRSFGDRIAIRTLQGELAAAFDEALGAAARAGNDSNAVYAAIAASVDQTLPSIDAAIESTLINWDDPMDLVELELEGAIAELEALRGGLSPQAPPAKQRELGGKIAHIARYILLLSHELGDPRQRAKRQQKPQSTAPLATLERAGGTLASARAPVDSEADTLELLGNKAALFSPQQATSIDPDATTATTTIAPEEAFAHHTDDLMASAQESIAAHARAQQKDLDGMMEQLAPKQVRRFSDFVPVYERWFSFFSKVARDRDQQFSIFAQIYEHSTALMGMAGTSGGLAYLGTQAGVSYTLRVPGVTSDVGSAVGGVGFERATSVRDQATRDGGAAADYDFAEVRPGTRGAGMSDERAARAQAGHDVNVSRRAAMDQVYRAQPADRSAVAAKTGLGGSGQQELALYGNADYASGRDGTQRDINFLLPVTVMEASGKLATVYEHKTMREEVARYLLAAAQQMQTLGPRGHEIQKEGGPRLGDAQGRAGNVEASTANASATYGGVGDPGAARSKRARTQIASTRAAAGIDPHTRAGSGSASQRLETALEASLDAFFASAGAFDRLMAIVMEIAVKEYELDHDLWSHISLDALWSFATQAVELGLFFWGLERLGPAGELAAAIIKQAMFKQSEMQLITIAMTLGGWLEGAMACTSFQRARALAFTFKPLANIVAQTVRDWAVQHVGELVGNGIGKAISGKPQRPMTTVGQLRTKLATMRGDAIAALREQLTTKLRGIEKGKPLPPDAHTEWAILNAVDPAAASRLRAQHTQLPELDDSSPLSLDASLSVDTSLHLTAKAAEVRSAVDTHLNNAQTIQPYRVEVMTPEQFKARFGSQQGRAAVVVHEQGTAVIYARADVRPHDLADEAMHLIQLNDPKSPQIAESIRMLGETTIGQWPKMDLEMRKQLFDRKLAVEIDAKERRLAELDVRDPDRQVVAKQLTQLQQLKSRSDAISPEQLQLLKAAPDRAPDFLKDPAWLFAKETTTTAGVNLRDATIDSSSLPTKVVTDSPVKGAKVTQIGEPWTETTVITASNSGKVAIDPANPSRVSVDGRVYVVEPGAQMHVKNGQIVGPGTPLATEPPASYRTVKVEPKKGPSYERLEYRSSKREGWVQAGEHTTKRGQATEAAARAQTTAELDARKRLAQDPLLTPRPDRLTDWVRLPHQNAQGQGFDDVIVEFLGDPPTAKIRIIEVKDYPNRTVPLGEMSAIRENLESNMLRLRATIRKAVDARRVEERPAALQNLTQQQLIALSNAEAANQISIELQLGASTGIGAESRQGSMLSKLRAELRSSKEFGGKDVLARVPTTLRPPEIP